MSESEVGPVPALEIRGLATGYGDIKVIHDLNLFVESGEIVCLLGPNGAGKSTVLKAVMGYLKATAGQVLSDGQDLRGREVHEVVRSGIGYVPQGRIVFPDMSVIDNLEVGGYLLPQGQRRDRIEEVIEFFPRLRERRREMAGRLSGGEQQMVAIARSLMTRPRVLLLDEPSLGLAPVVADQVFEELVQLNARWKVTMMLVEQNAVRALSISHRGYVLDLGRNRYDGPSAALLADPAIRQMYLGG
jgi:branched-chain amino acid transport system ATP-binding protein